jgi:hypothetical protein
VVVESYGFEDFSMVKDFILSNDISQEDLNGFISYIEGFRSDSSVPLDLSIYFTILGNKLVYGKYWLSIKEQIESYRERYRLAHDGLVRIIECNRWSATRDEAKGSVVVKYNNNGDKLDWLIYIYKDYIVFSNCEGSCESVYKFENFCILYDKNLGKE